MNTLFERFKDYALTAEQAEKVRGGDPDYCQIFGSCYDNADYAVASSGLSKEGKKELELNLKGACNDYFWDGCWSQISNRING